MTRTKSPLFTYLYSILTNETLNSDTQRKIELYLLTPGLKSILKDEKLFKNNSKIIHLLIESKDSLNKLISNYKKNILFKDPNLFGSDLKLKLFYETPNEFLIEVIFGRILVIISNNHIISKKTVQTEVAINLGKEITKNYLSMKFKNSQNLNPELTYLNWKSEQFELFEFIADSQIQFELGNYLINFMIELSLIKTVLKIQARDDKVTLLVANSNLEKLILKEGINSKLQVTPKRLPMIVPPKKYIWSDNDYSQLGGYLLNGKLIPLTMDLKDYPQLEKNNEIYNKLNINKDFLIYDLGKNNYIIKQNIIVEENTVQHYCIFYKNNKEYCSFIDQLPHEVTFA